MPKTVAAVLMYNALFILFVLAIFQIEFNIGWVIFDLAELFVGTMVYIAKDMKES